MTCRGLCVQRGGKAVLHGINLEIPAGACVALVGPNGSGKTTLMLAMLGLLPVTAGSVRLFGTDPRGMRPRARGQAAAYVPQVLQNAPALSVADVVKGGRYPYRGSVGRTGPDDEQHVRRAIRLCGLAPLAAHPFDRLSGGERQKTLLAAAIAQDPRMLFLDEPNTALDPAYQLELVRVLRAWHESGRGIVLISHDLMLPGVLDARVAALRDGRMVADGPASEVLTPERLAVVYGSAFEMVTTAQGRRLALPAWWRA